jgi:adhesin/invasin
MIRFARCSFAFVAVLVALAACGSDSSSSTSPGASLTGNTLVVDSASQGQAAVVASTITIGFRVMNSTATVGVANQTVTITPAVGSGTVSPTTVTSDANGHATVSWTLGTVAGPVSLSLSATGVNSTATATALSAAPTKLVRVSTDSQTVVASASASLVVRSADQYGNPVPNVPVTWTSNAGTITPTATTTGPSGNAVVTFTTDPLPATYSITASSPGLTPITFTLKGS